MKTRTQIKLQVLEEMPYASDLQVNEEVDIRMNEQTALTPEQEKQRGYTSLPIHQRINAKHNAVFNWTFRGQDLMKRLSKKDLEWCNVMYDPDRMILSRHRQDEPVNAGYPDYDAPSIQEQSEKAYKQKYS